MILNNSEELLVRMINTKIEESNKWERDVDMIGRRAILAFCVLMFTIGSTVNGQQQQPVTVNLIWEYGDSYEITTTNPSIVLGFEENQVAPYGYYSGSMPVTIFSEYPFDLQARDDSNEGHMISGVNLLSDPLYMQFNNNGYLCYTLPGQTSLSLYNGEAYRTYAGTLDFRQLLQAEDPYGDYRADISLVCSHWFYT